MRPRVIPILLIDDEELYKTVKFKNPIYVGDPINAVRIFNDKEVDEIAILDIGASKNNKEPNFEMIKKFASEAFMPLSYGGGISNVEQITKIISYGVEKVILNTNAFKNNFELIKQAAAKFGNQSIVVSIDFKKNIFGKYKVYFKSGKEDVDEDVFTLVKQLEDIGCGELILQSIENDGMMTGYDLDFIKKISSIVNVPIIALGGASNLNDIRKAHEAGASAVAAGSMFIFHGKHKAILITYPSEKELKHTFDGL